SQNIAYNQLSKRSKLSINRIVECRDLPRPRRMIRFGIVAQIARLNKEENTVHLVFSVITEVDRNRKTPKRRRKAQATLSNGLLKLLVIGKRRSLNKAALGSPTISATYRLIRPTLREYE